VNLLVYADSGPQLAALFPAISGLGVHAPRLVMTWDALIKACDEQRPDAVVICFAVFGGGEPRVAIEAREQLRERGVPAVALISAGNPPAPSSAPRPARAR
jgi:methylmalonyl-CoA mutase cobalamin-binding subunit